LIVGAQSEFWDDAMRFKETKGNISIRKRSDNKGNKRQKK
jgi:hypothetical protein